MARMRLGAALLVPHPIAAEIEGLRRACGDGARSRVMPHLTLVPPVNVSESRLGEALALLRAAAAIASDLTLSLGPPASFLPDSPTLYLRVTGEQLGLLHAVRDALFKPPLERPLTFPFVPHVTLADDMAPDRIASAVSALRDFVVDVTFESVHLLRELRDDAGVRWSPIAGQRFGPPIVVGRGGYELELSVGDVADPAALALLDSSGDAGEPSSRGWTPLVVTARHRGELVGVISGATRDGCSRLDALVVREGERGRGIGHHLRARFVAEGGTVVGGAAADR